MVWTRLKGASSVLVSTVPIEVGHLEIKRLLSLFTYGVKCGCF